MKSIYIKLKKIFTLSEADYFAIKNSKFITKLNLFNFDLEIFNQLEYIIGKRVIK